MRNNGVIAAAQVLWQSVALFIVYRVGAQAAGIGTLGAWSTAVAIGGLITIADAGFTDVAVREVAHANGSTDWARVKGLCRSLLRVVPLAVGLVGILAVPAIASVLHALTPTLGDDTATVLAAGAVTSVWLTVLGTGTAGVLEAFGRYDLKAIAAFVSSTLSIPAAYVAVRFAPDLAIVVALVTGAAANLVLLLGAATHVLRRVPGRARAPTASERSDMLRRGINARLGALANLGLDPVIRFLLLRFGGAEAAGLYELVYRLVLQLRGVFVASTQVIVPRLTRERAAGTTGGAAVIRSLTASSLRLAGPTLWGILIVLPLLSAAMLGRIEVALLTFGLALTLAWLLNVIAVPAYFGNFVDGALSVNRTSHVVMVVTAAALGTPAGYYLAGFGVVAGTSVAIALGSVYLLASRGHDWPGARLDLARADYAVNVVGIVGAAVVYLAAFAGAAFEQQVYTALAVAAVYGVSASRHLTRLVATHLRLVAG